MTEKVYGLRHFTMISGWGMRRQEPGESKLVMGGDQRKGKKGKRAELLNELGEIEEKIAERH